MRRTSLLGAATPLVCFIAIVCAVTLGWAGSAHATPSPTDLILDAGPLGNYCGNAVTGCYGSAATSGANPNTKDVIGAKNDFDAKSIQFTTWTSTHIVGDIVFNYNGGDTLLQDFVEFGFTLRVGDLLFSAGGLEFGIALKSHDGLDAGQLYAVDGFLDSDQFGLDHSKVIWRDSYWCQQYGGSNCSTPPVRMNSAGAIALGLPGTVLVTAKNEGLYANGIELNAHLDFNPGGDSGLFWQTYLANNGLDTSFASAICANDIVQGHITPAAVPEPATWILLGFGGAALVLWRRTIGMVAVRS